MVSVWFVDLQLVLPHTWGEHTTNRAVLCTKIHLSLHKIPTSFGLWWTLCQPFAYGSQTMSIFTNVWFVNHTQNGLVRKCGPALTFLWCDGKIPTLTGMGWCYSVYALCAPKAGSSESGPALETNIHEAYVACTRNARPGRVRRDRTKPNRLIERCFVFTTDLAADFQFCLYSSDILLQLLSHFVDFKKIFYNNVIKNRSGKVAWNSPGNYVDCYKS